MPLESVILREDFVEMESYLENTLSSDAIQTQTLIKTFSSEISDTNTMFSQLQNEITEATAQTNNDEKEAIND